MKCNSKKDELSRLLLSEVATGGVLKEFLKISENSQENTFARVSFLIKLQAEVTASLLYSGGILHCYKRNQQESCNWPKTSWNRATNMLWQKRVLENGIKLKINEESSV